MPYGLTVLSTDGLKQVKGLHARCY